MRSEQDDDPEKRIAELERRQGRASAGRPVDQPPAYPPAPQPGWQQAPNPYPAQPQPGWQQTPSWPQQPQPWQPPVDQSEYCGPPLAYSASLPANYQPLQGRRPRGKSRRKYAIVVAALVVAVTVLAVAGMKGHQVYAYTVGTPTTAQVDYCEGGRSDSCKGSWTIDGINQYGTIEGAESDVGSTVDVRVHNGTAYTKRVVSIFLALLLGLLGWGLGIYWYVRRQRRLT
jgi:hypothetical protein